MFNLFVEESRVVIQDIKMIEEQLARKLVHYDRSLLGSNVWLLKTTIHKHYRLLPNCLYRHIHQLFFPETFFINFIYQSWYKKTVTFVMAIIDLLFNTKFQIWHTKLFIQFGYSTPHMKFKVIWDRILLNIVNNFVSSMS